MALNGAISTTSFTDRSLFTNTASTLFIKTIHIQELQASLTALDTYSVNVDNCGYTNCCESCQDTCICQSDKCQSCQNTCNQCTDKCQWCQNTCNQCTDYCQSCNGCQNTCNCQYCQHM